MCYKGYICTVGDNNYTGECVHMCALNDILCQNKGYCYYDVTVNQTACRCGGSIMTVYYGPRCEEKTGRMEFVVGLSVGVLGGLISIALVLLFCKRLSDGEDRRKKTNDFSDDLSIDTNEDLRSLHENLNMFEYGVTNQVYDRFRNEQRLSESSMYLPRKTMPGPGNPSHNQQPSQLTFHTVSLSLSLIFIRIYLLFSI
ncbi:uncharacterized protein LOC111122884 [Crassostrea virginica]